MEFTRDAQPKPDDVLLAAPVPRAMDGTPKAAIKEAVEDVIYGSVSSLIPRPHVSVAPGT